MSIMYNGNLNYGFKCAVCRLLLKALLQYLLIAFWKKEKSKKENTFKRFYFLVFLFSIPFSRYFLLSPLHILKHSPSEVSSKSHPLLHSAVNEKKKKNIFSLTSTTLYNLCEPSLGNKILSNVEEKKTYPACHPAKNPHGLAGQYCLDHYHYHLCNEWQMSELIRSHTHIDAPTEMRR